MKPNQITWVRRLIIVILVSEILAGMVFSPLAITTTAVAAGPKPSIRITYVPPYGSYASLVGQVAGVDPADYGVAVYIKVRGGWWTKPYWANPVTIIYSNGLWVCDVVTGGIDQYASDYAAFLIPLSYRPPLMYAGANLPAGLKRNAVAKAVAHRSTSNR